MARTHKTIATKFAVDSASPSNWRACGAELHCFDVSVWITIVKKPSAITLNLLLSYFLDILIKENEGRERL